MRGVTWIVAHNKILGFYRKKSWISIFAIILVCFIFPVLLGIKWYSKQDCTVNCSKEWIDGLYGFSFFVEYILLSLLAVYAFQEEKQSKSLLSILSTSISRIELLLGKMLGCLVIHCFFIAVLFVTHILICLKFQLPITFNFYISEFIDNIFYGVMIILILVSLSLVFSTPVSLSLFIIFYWITILFQLIDNDVHIILTSFKKILYYVTPLQVEKSLFEMSVPSFSNDELTKYILARIGSLMYSIVIFMMCLVLTKNSDLSLKD
ncbi:MAG: ABC transporter permease [Pseudomonadota bacterium]